MFATKFRLEKKKYSLHPGTTYAISAPDSFSLTLFCLCSDYMDRFLDEQENMALTNMSSSSSSLNNIQSTNRQQLHHSFRSSPSANNLITTPHKSDHILMDDLSTQYANINSLCDSASNNVNHMGGPAMGAFVNGYYKKNDSSESVLMCSNVSHSASANAKVCHSVSGGHHNPHPNSDWVAQQQSVTTTTAGANSSSDVNSDFIRRQAISSTTLINDSNISSNNKSNSA